MRPQDRSVVIHGHFYQPPREDPGFDEVETEESAFPFHDWNQRVERECYHAVVAARVHADGRIARVVNTLEWISFNVGPTLCEWLARQAPDTWRRMRAADEASVARLGHGNAIAHPYHHVILPLASRRDKVTEVRWGMADFRQRFGREPEGMWLPETAVDDETLDVLAEAGIRFTILAPHQLGHAAPNGHAGRYVTANGRAIALFPYHGDISHGVAFGGLVKNAEHWMDALLGVRASRRKTPAHGAEAVETGPKELLVSAATDGETYGHHHKFAEMALAHVLEQCRARGVTVENYASFLARHPADHDVTLHAPSAWSCSHGVERWRANCGCRMDGDKAPSQGWRAPLREGLNALAEKLHAIFVRDGAHLLGDAWAAREAYASVVIGGPVAQRDFLGQWLRSGATEGEATRALELLEMERDALRMFTSCAWFFDDIGGLEPAQVLRYARRAVTLSRTAEPLEAALMSTLGTAVSNRPGVGSGRDVYVSVTRASGAMLRVAAAARAVQVFTVNGVTDPGLGPPGAGHETSLIPHGFEARDTGTHVTVTDLRTRRVERFMVSLDEQTSRDVRYRVRPVPASGASREDEVMVSLAEFPEAARHAVRTALRNALLPRCLTTTELQDVASGVRSLREVAASALCRAMDAIGEPADVLALERAAAALDLFEQLEVHVPFDAQTLFWDAWANAGTERREVLRELGRRLGFALT